MKIFVLPSWYKSDKYPENCIFIYEQVVGLSNRGHQLVVLSPQLKLKPSFSKVIIHSNDGASDILYKNYWGIWPSKLPRQNIISYRKCATLLFRKAVERYGVPDVLYAHFSEPAGYVATELGKRYNVPVVVIEHQSDLMQERWARYKIKLISETIRHSKNFLCVSRGLKESILDKLGEHTHIDVVSNMINPIFRYYPIDNKGRFVFLSIGSLIPRKGFAFLIRCFAKAFKGQNVELRIAGKGKQKDILLKLISDLKVEGQVTLLGQLSREETLHQYIQCNCFVLASQAETFGLVYREAMAVGRPIISTKHGGFSESDWYNDYGLLVDYGDEIEMIKALENIYDHYTEFELKKISDLCLSTCSEEVVMSQIEGFLNG